jgi:4-amino-4-deoxy-L-arabinose transferase-like glycosyltransferase
MREQAPGDHPPSEDRPVWTILFAVAAALLAVRYSVLLLTDLSLHGDEAQYWTWSRDFAFGYYSKPPMIAWVIGAATSVCGDAAWCVRAPAALLHIGTAFVLTALAQSLFDRRVALWTGIVWLTIPAVSYSSLIMSTDAVLLLFWSAALWAYHRVLTRPDWRAAAVLAIAFGLGLNAKYAMAYFLLCAIVHWLLCADARRALRAAWLYLAGGFALGAAMILPNVAWNAANGWATVGHTADNAHWQGIVLHPGEMLEFLGAQFGVFGPVLFGALLLSIPVTRGMSARLSGPARLLLSFCLPVLVTVSIQALLSRANANWAATAYPAATILVTAALLQSTLRRRLLLGSTLVHLVAAGGFYLLVLNPDFAPRGLAKKLGELDGWTETADAVRDRMADQDVTVLLMDNRLMMASLAYALRDSDVTIRAWNHDSKIDHHYEMAWLYDPQRDGGRVLLATPHDAAPYEQAFGKITVLDPILRRDRHGRETELILRLLEEPR